MCAWVGVYRHLQRLNAKPLTDLLTMTDPPNWIKASNRPTGVPSASGRERLAVSSLTTLACSGLPSQRPPLWAPCCPVGPCRVRPDRLETSSWTGMSVVGVSGHIAAGHRCAMSSGTRCRRGWSSERNCGGGAACARSARRSGDRGIAIALAGAPVHSRPVPLPVPWGRVAGTPAGWGSARLTAMLGPRSRLSCSRGCSGHGCCVRAAPPAMARAPAFPHDWDTPPPTRRSTGSLTPQGGRGTVPERALGTDN